MSNGELVETPLGVLSPRSIVLRRAGTQGAKGDDGAQGLSGPNGWAPIFTLVADDARRVFQIADWVGGAGVKPPVGKYLGDDALVDDIADALDVRGPAGDGSGDMLASVYDPTGKAADAFSRANHTGTQTLATISDAGTMAAQSASDYTNTVGMNAALASLQSNLETQIEDGDAALQTQIIDGDAALAGSISSLNTSLQAQITSGDAALQTQINKRVSVSAAQSFTLAEQGQGRANVGADVLAGFRNKLINGAGAFIQRGSRTIAAGSAAYVFDRWYINNVTNQALTVSRVSLGLGSGFAPGAKFAMRISFSVAPTTGGVRVEQRIEGVDTIIPGDWTCSAWMSGPTGTETLAAEIVQNFGTGGSPSNPVTTSMTFAGGSPTTIYSASTNRRCWGVTAPSISGKILGTNGNDYTSVAIMLSPRQTGNYDMTWLSFVRGNAASETDPFSPRHAMEELLMAQRYFFKTYDVDMVPGTISIAGAQFMSTSVTQNFNSVGTIQFPGQMRARPTVTLYSPTSGDAGKIAVDSSTNVTGLTSWLGCRSVGVVVDNASTSGPASFMTVHLTADAEI